MFYEKCSLDKENSRPQSSREASAAEYLKKRHIKELFHFLQCIILAEEPDDPFRKLVQTLDQLISYRDGQGEPPMLFPRELTDAVFATMDPLETHTLRRRQFIAGMQAMGLPEDVSDDGSHMKRDLAVEKAVRRQRELVKEMVTPAVYVEEDMRSEREREEKHSE